MDKKLSKKQQQVLLRYIQKLGKGELLPELINAKLVSYCRDVQSVPKNEQKDYANADYAWAIYIAHDSCHDAGKYKDDRNTVVAFNRYTGIYKILGRELPRSIALKIATGKL